MEGTAGRLKIGDTAGSCTRGGHMQQIVLKTEGTAGRYTLGGHSRDFKSGGHSREIHTWRTQKII